MADFITLDNLRRFKENCDETYGNNNLNVDATPTEGSDNPVSSGGVKTYTDETIASNLEIFKQTCDNDYMSTKEIDNAPTEGSENLITSGGVKTYVDAVIAEAIDASITQALGGNY